MTNETPDEYWEKNKDWFLERIKVPCNLENLIKIAFVEGLVQGLKAAPTVEQKTNEDIAARLGL